MWKMDCKRLGIERPKGFGPHKIRHTGITIMETRTDNNTAAISQMVGHKSQAVHDIYTHQEVMLAPGEKGHFGSGEKGQLSVG
jgi:integrase